MSVIVPCQVCSSSSRTHVISHEGMEIFRCGDCGLVFVSPMPEPSEIAAHYTGGYTSATRGYFAKVDKKMRRARGRVWQLRRYISGGTFLDVGCNGGFVTQAARECGFAAYGLDIDPVLVAYAREHYPDNTFFVSSLEAFDPGPLRFDAVYCSEVIEHVSDANRFVAALSAVMRMGAFLYLTTPDISHWRRPRDLRAWDGFKPPRHCLYFTPANLTLLLERHRIKVVKRRLALKPGIKLFAHKLP